MQSIMSVIINMNECELKRKGQPKLLSDLEQKKSRSMVTGKVCSSGDLIKVYSHAKY